MDAERIERIADALEALDRRHGAPQARESYIAEAERFAAAFAAVTPQPTPAVVLNRPKTRLLRMSEG